LIIRYGASINCMDPEPYTNDCTARVLIDCPQIQSLRVHSLGRTYSRGHLESSQSLSRILINRMLSLRSSFRPSRPNTLFNVSRSHVVAARSQQSPVAVQLDVFDQQSKMHHRRQQSRQALGLIRKPAHGRQNVRNTVNQRLGAAARASPFDPPY
jgi:hypothetical protein